MPRTRLDRFSKPRPDLVKALILERCAAHPPGFYEELAAGMGISIPTWFKRKRQPTSEWPLGEVLAACRMLDVDLADLRAAIRY